jgi:hypothetical protein
MPFPVAALLLLLQATDPQEQGLKALEARQYPAAIARIRARPSPPTRVITRPTFTSD